MRPEARRTNIFRENLPNEVIVYDKMTQHVHCLNNTAGIVWESADGTRSIEDLSRLVESRLKISAGRDLVLTSLEELAKAGLLEKCDEQTASVVSRRHVAKQFVTAGASAALLPVIASILAPSAKAAGSPSLSQLKTDAQDAYALVAPFASRTPLSPAQSAALADYRAGEGIYTTDEAAGSNLNSAQAQTDFANAFAAMGQTPPAGF